MLSHFQTMQRLKQSQTSVMIVNDMLTYRGWKVIVPKMKFAPDKSQIEAYQDQGDIFINDKYDKYTIEVKHNTGHEAINGQWPFSLVCINTTESHCRVNPDYYFIFDRDFTLMYFVDIVKTRSHWQKMDIWDSVNKVLRNSYLCHHSKLQKFLNREEFFTSNVLLPNWQ